MPHTKNEHLSLEERQIRDAECNKKREYKKKRSNQASANRQYRILLKIEMGDAYDESLITNDKNEPLVEREKVLKKASEMFEKHKNYLANGRLGILEYGEYDSTNQKPAPSPPLYPLQRNWTWWYLNENESESWSDRLKKVFTFNTVLEFWTLYESICAPSELPAPSEFFVFRDEIRPMWEVDENKNGGRWSIFIDKSKKSEIMDAIWLEILLVLMGEQFGEEMNSICGLVCDVGLKGSKISVWTKNNHDNETNLRIGTILQERIREALALKTLLNSESMYMEYERHFQRESGSAYKKLTLALS